MSQYIINTFEKMQKYIDEICKHDRIAVDTETFGPPKIGGLHAFHGSRSFSIIFATKSDEFYFDFNTDGIDPKHKILLQKIFDDENRIVFFCNAVFDCCIMHFDNLKVKCRIIDCPTIARVEFNKHGKRDFDKESFLSLRYLTEYYQVQNKIDLVKEYIKEHDLYQKDKDGKYIRSIFDGKKIPEFNLVPIDLMTFYACGDARSTYDLGNKILQCINWKDEQYEKHRDGKPTMLALAQQEVKLTPVLIDMKIKGFRHWHQYTEKALVHEKEISLRLHKEIDKLTKGINLNSGIQIANFLMSKGVVVPFKKPTEHALLQCDKWIVKREQLVSDLNNLELKHRVRESKKKQIKQATEKIASYKKGNPKTDKKTLAKLMKEYPNLDFLDKITEAKEADKKIGTYYQNFMNLQDDLFYIHCELNQEKAKTGRFASANPNLQNLEKVYTKLNSAEFAVRKSFIADEGCRLFFFDYDQEEMIFMLDQAGEMGVIEKLLSGEYEDFYMATAAQLKDILGIVKSRYDTKQMSLALAYGKGLEKLAIDLGYIGANADQEEIDAGKEKAGKFKKQFFSALKQIKRLQKNLERDCKYHGKIHNPFGRVSYFDGSESYKSLNSFVQGSSADIMKKAMIDIVPLLKAAGLKTRMTLCVHDELIFNIPIGEEAKAIPIIKKAMTEAYQHIHIPLTVGVDYSPINESGVSSWSEKIPYVA